MKSRNWISAGLMALASIFGPALLDDENLTSNNRANAGGLLIADGGFGGVLEIKQQDISVVINNGIAVTEINQVFLNTENRIVEALYSFPVPNGASVSNFSMVINGKEMVGEVVEKKRARQIYDSYKSTKRDPGLLEQVNYKTFELRVFPIQPQAEQHIKIVYYQQLDFDHNNATYVYPLATTTKAVINEKTSGRFSMTMDIKSQIPITKVYSPSHSQDFVINAHNDNYSRANMEITAGDLSRDVVIAFDTERPHTGVDLIANKQADEDGYFMLTMTAGKELEEYGAGMDYVFVVDISGSMADQGKLRLATSVVDAFVDELGVEDRFEIIAFNNAPNLHFQSLQSAIDDNKKSAAEFLKDQRAVGGTVLRPAITTAYKYKDADRPLNVVVLSDGMTQQNEQSELIGLIGNAPSSTRVFCVGIGNEVNRPLLKQLSERAGGLAAFVSLQDDFKRQSQAFRRKLMRPVATNVRIKLNGVETYDVLPEVLPDLFYGAPLRMIGRYKQGGVSQVSVSGEVMGKPFEQKIDINLPKSSDDNPEIERMWAYCRVEQLMSQMRERGASPEKEAEIVRLCEGFSIASEYASFIVLENDSEYQRWSIQRRNATRVRRDDAARNRLQVQLERLREQSLADIGPSKSPSSSKPVDTLSDSSSAPIAERTRVANRPSDLFLPTTTPSAPIASDSASSAPQTRFNESSRNVQRPSGGGGGGGAIDPISCAIALGMAGASAWAAGRRRSTKSEPSETKN
ncbi:MAG: VWA domain-containing protein [Planctomycetaceae bacterium]|jgi:Ca-activated chloride channel family protein|nr:VWA domain-containing protein [Planctomycetaceae bacterium]